MKLTGISGPGLSATFTYDALGHRTSKTINGATTSFLYDGLNIVQEQVGGSPSANLLTAGIDTFLSRTDASGSRSPLQDATGSVIGLTDVSGAIQTGYSYEPFGKTTTSGAASSNPNQFTGREDDGTGLYYYRARYYSPTLQRFISEDPIGLVGGINLYAYAGNDPLSFTDPSGLKPNDPWISEEGFCHFLGVVGTAAAGFGDRLSGGVTNKIRDLTGANSAVNKYHPAYEFGDDLAICEATALGGAMLWEMASAEAIGLGLGGAGAAGSGYTAGGGSILLGRGMKVLEEFLKDNPSLAGVRILNRLPNGMKLEDYLRAEIDAAETIYFRMKDIGLSPWAQWEYNYIRSKPELVRKLIEIEQ